MVLKWKKFESGCNFKTNCNSKSGFNIESGLQVAPEWKYWSEYVFYL